jgi:hypothetical protein
MSNSYLAVRVRTGWFKEWRPVRESNPCRRREREATYGNAKELREMDHLTALNGLTGIVNGP